MIIPLILALIIIFIPQPAFATPIQLPPCVIQTPYYYQCNIPRGKVDPSTLTDLPCQMNTSKLGLINICKHPVNNWLTICPPTQSAKVQYYTYDYSQCPVTDPCKEDFFDYKTCCLNAKRSVNAQCKEINTQKQALIYDCQYAVINKMTQRFRTFLKTHEFTLGSPIDNPYSACLTNPEVNAIAAEKDSWNELVEVKANSRFIPFPPHTFTNRDEYDWSSLNQKITQDGDGGDGGGGGGGGVVNPWVQCAIGVDIYGNERTICNGANTMGLAICVDSNGTRYNCGLGVGSHPRDFITQNLTQNKRFNFVSATVKIIVDEAFSFSGNYVKWTSLNEKDPLEPAFDTKRKCSIIKRGCTDPWDSVSVFDQQFPREAPTQEPYGYENISYFQCHDDVFPYPDLGALRDLNPFEARPPIRKSLQTINMELKWVNAADSNEFLVRDYSYKIGFESGTGENFLNKCGIAEFGYKDIVNNVRADPAFMVDDKFLFGNTECLDITIWLSATLDLDSYYASLGVLNNFDDFVDFLNSLNNPNVEKMSIDPILLASSTPEYPPVNLSKPIEEMSPFPLRPRVLFKNLFEAQANGFEFHQFDFLDQLLNNDQRKAYYCLKLDLDDIINFEEEFNKRFLALIDLLPSSPPFMRIPTMLSNMFQYSTLARELAIMCYNAGWQYLVLIAALKLYRLIPGKRT